MRCSVAMRAALPAPTRATLSATNGRCRRASNAAARAPTCRRSGVTSRSANLAPRASPSFAIGYEGRLQTIKPFILSFDSLQVIGRYGTFRYNNADHSVETGLLAARNILGERYALDVVNADKEYLEIK